MIDGFLPKEALEHICMPSINLVWLRQTATVQVYPDPACNGTPVYSNAVNSAYLNVQISQFFFL